MRVGIIGRGWGERVVAPSFAATEGCEVVDVVTPRDHDAVVALCRRPDVDLVAVHSPPFLHARHVRLALEAGHAVLCDKPFGLDTAEAVAMCALADDAGVPAYLNFEHRFDESRQVLHRLVVEGAVGEPEHVAWAMLLATWRVPLRPYGWIFDERLGGGWLRAAGSHLVDFVRWTFGEITEVGGQVRSSTPERPDPEGVLRTCTADDGFVATLRTERGATAVIDSTAGATVNLDPSIVVVGSGGALQVAGERIVLHDADGVHERYAPPNAAYDPAVPQLAFAAVLRDAFHDGATDDVPTFADGLACVRVMDRLLSGTTPPPP